MRAETHSQKVTATKSPLASSAASVSGLDERCDLGVRNARRDPLSWAARPPAALWWTDTGSVHS